MANIPIPLAKELISTGILLSTLQTYANKYPREKVLMYHIRIVTRTTGVPNLTPKLYYKPFENLSDGEQLLKNYLSFVHSPFQPYTDIYNTLNQINRLLLQGIKNSWEIKPRGDMPPSNYLDKWAPLIYKHPIRHIDLPEFKLDFYKQLLIPVQLILKLPLRFINTTTLLGYTYVTLTQNWSQSTALMGAPYLLYAIKSLLNQPHQSQYDPTSVTLTILDTINDYLVNTIEALKFHIEKELDVIETLSKRQKRIVAYLKRNKVAKRQQLSRLFKVSWMTIYRDIKKLRELGLIKTIGSGKEIRYQLDPRIEEILRMG